jgi:hypothetical protein
LGSAYLLEAAEVQPTPARPHGVLDRLSRPHVYVTFSLIAVLIIVSFRKRKRPDIATVIEIMAYGAALWGASSLFLRGADMTAEEPGAWESIAGAVALFAAAITGVWDSLKKI